MSREGTSTEEDLRQQLLEARSRIRELEAELAETNEGMIALTLELENAKERYRTLFEESNDAILLIDPETNTIHECNSRACEVLKYSRDSLLSLSPSDIFPEKGEESETFAEAVIHGWANGFTCRAKNGRKFEVDVSASIVTLDGRSLLLASLRDITQRKRREQRLQVLNRIFRHNLRNDGNVIQGHADILHDSLLGSEFESNARTIKRTIDRILEVSGKVRRIQDVLDSDHVTLKPVSSMLETQRETFERSHHDADVSISPPTNDAVVGQRLNAVLREAVENALEHAQPEPTIAIEAEVDEDRTRLLLEIKDDGPGVPEYEKRALEAGGETPLTHGSGVGLWFIQWVVDSLGGELSIRDAEPTGTVLSVHLPVEENRNSTKEPIGAYHQRFTDG